jgi:hypothetical protein
VHVELAPERDLRLAGHADLADEGFAWIDDLQARGS